MNWLLRIICSLIFFAALIPEKLFCVEYMNDTRLKEAILASSEFKQVSRARRYVSVRTFKVDQAGQLQFSRVNISLNQQSRFLTKFGPYIIKLHLYLDRQFESRMHRNRAEMIKISKQVVNHANTLLRPLNTYLMVTSLHFPWNPLATNYDIPDKDVLEFIREMYTYNNYRVMVEQVIDCVFVFVGRSLDNFTMSDSEGSVCEKKFGRPTCVGFVTLDTNRPNYVNLSGFALAHELAHRLGSSHDSTVKCHCNFAQCLMDDSVGGATDGTKQVGWSACSIDQVAGELDELALNKACLSARWNSPTRTDGINAEYSTDWGASCGNGILEPGEECDCGGPLACKDNRCCQSDVCKLTVGAACGTGDCCNTTSCTPLANGTLCRLTEDPRCDFPEFCDGKLPTCPSDLSVVSDWPCDAASSGRCRLRHCLPPQDNFAKYSGRKCLDSKSVPTTAGDCKPEHKPGPAEQIEDWVEPDASELAATAEGSKSHKPILAVETTDQQARQLLGVPWLVSATSATLAAALNPHILF